LLGFYLKALNYLGGIIEEIHYRVPEKQDHRGWVYHAGRAYVTIQTNNPAVRLLFESEFNDWTWEMNRPKKKNCIVGKAKKRNAHLQNPRLWKRLSEETGLCFDGRCRALF